MISISTGFNNVPRSCLTNLSFALSGLFIVLVCCIVSFGGFPSLNDAKYDHSWVQRPYIQSDIAVLVTVAEQDVPALRRVLCMLLSAFYAVRAGKLIT